jgi:predicted RNA binding protein YcfA (HicA-like mRNA interferase family)
MPSLPRVSGAQTIRALERLGFVVVRQRGSHVVLRRGAIGCVVRQS